MKAAALITLVALAGCATTSPQEEAAFAEIANRPITCAAGTDCDMKWGRAQTWLLENASFKIATQTDSLITTHGPTVNSPQAAFTVSKVPAGEGVFTITMRGGCDNMFGCTPSIDRSKAAFYKALTGS